MELNSQSIAVFLMIGSTAFAYFQFQKAANWNKWVGAAMALWLMVLVILGLVFHFNKSDTQSYFYSLIFFTPILSLILVNIPKYKSFVKSLRTKSLTWIYLTRIPLGLLISFNSPLEIQLHDNYYEIMIPEAVIQAIITLTIVISITTPVIVNLANWDKLKDSLLFTLWNIISTLLLLYNWLWETLTIYNAISAYTLIWVLGFLIPILLLTNIKLLFKWNA